MGAKQGLQNLLPAEGSACNGHISKVRPRRTEKIWDKCARFIIVSHILMKNRQLLGNEIVTWTAP